MIKPHPNGLLVLACIACTALSSRTVEVEDPVAQAAITLLESLEVTQRKRVSIDFDDPNRLDWHFFPRARRGLAIGELSVASRERLDALLASALSLQGVAKVEGVFELEAILYELESRPDRPAHHRDPGKYVLAMFGAPRDDAPWGWRLEGHHLSLNYSSVTRALTAHTPSFFGANPARIESGEREGRRLLGAEEDLARELVTSLGPEQSAAGVHASGRPGDIVFGPGRDSFDERPEGVPASELDEEQRGLLRELLGQYVGNLNDDMARREMRRIEGELTEIHFLWIGSTEAGEPFYYRVHGPSFIVEFDVVGQNHVHSVWRDLESDFGLDHLRQHRARDHAGR